MLLASQGGRLSCHLPTARFPSQASNNGPSSNVYHLKCLPRNYTTDNNRWKVLQKPFKPTFVTEKVLTKRKVALKVAYTGTGYFGSQKTGDDRPTIEGTIEKALYNSKMILDTNYGFLDKIGWTRSSRTDKGVHSLATVFGCRLEGLWTRVMGDRGEITYDIKNECVELPELINKHLPEDIRVLAAAPVQQHWDARRACIRRKYEYLIPHHILDGSLYHTKPEEWDRLLQYYLGRHHWHNYGQIDKKPRVGGNRSRRSKIEDITDQEEGEGQVNEHIQVETDSLGEVNIPKEMIKKSIAGTNLEPSLMSVAPCSKNPNFTSTSPLLEEYQQLKADLLKNPPVAPLEAEQPKKRGRKSNRERESPPAMTPETVTTSSTPMESLDLAEESSDTKDEDMLQLLAREEASFTLEDWRNPAKVASIPFDSHLSQAAFFRHITSVGHDQVEIGNQLYVRITFVGDSFLLHQVRRMVGMLVATARGTFSEDAFMASIDAPFRMVTPRAPPQGLLLRDAQFYDVDFEGREVGISQAFAMRYVYPHLDAKWTTGQAQLSNPESPEKDPWFEVLNTTPVHDIRSIIPGFDTWKRVHEQEQLLKSERREYYESNPHLKPARQHKGNHGARRKYDNPVSL